MVKKYNVIIVLACTNCLWDKAFILT